MSASTERKLRQAARAAGTDKKMLAAQEEAARKKKNNRRWTLGLIAIALLIVVILILDSGILYTHTKALTIADESYSPAEVSYRYADQYFSLINQYGSYAPMFGLSTSGIGSLATSTYSEGVTWKEFLLNQTVEGMVQTKALTDYAELNGITLDEDEIAEIDESVAQLDTYARAQGFRSGSKLLAANYGNGVTTAIMRQASLDSALASKAYTSYRDGLSYTAEELEEEYQSFNGDRDLFSFLLYTCTAAVAEDAEGPTEEALQEAHADAMAISMAFTDGTDIEDTEERFEVAVDSQFEGQVPTARTDVSGSSLSESYKEWMLEAERAEGDVLVFDTETGSGVVVFLSRNDNHYATATVRHILVRAEADEDGNYTDEAKAAALARAEEILAEYEAGEQTEESFAALAEEYSEDSGSNTNGGLYENVPQGQMVEEFDAFCYAEHEPGDTAIVYGESGSYAGYHVMYYVGEGRQYSDVLAEDALRSSDLQTWLEELASGYEAVRGGGFRFVG